MFLLFIIGLQSQGSYAQLTVTPTSTATLLAAKLAGPGITIISDTLICNSLGNGTFTSVSTPISIDSGVILSTGKVAQASGSEPALTSTNFGATGDNDLLPLIGSATVTVDACQLIINFVPHGDTVSFRYQFASEEYRQSTCGTYNDAFGFFISGPGVSASLPGVNMALVPGTTIAVSVNSVNSGVPGSTPGCTLANCTALGPGSPFTAYYVNNTGGTTVAYRGITDVFTAKHDVTPCDTYRIKLSIADAGNGLYDSGVFIEAGSLKTNTYHFNRNDSIGYTVAGLPHTLVKGCKSDTIRIISAYPVPVATTLNLSYSGTSVSGFDYVPLPSSVVIPAGDTSAMLIVTGLSTPPAGDQSLNILLTAASACGTIDSISLSLRDHPFADITSPDTSICTGTSVQLFTTGSADLTYSWSPAASLDDATLPNPTATPFATTTYTMSADLAGSRCASILDSVTISTSSIGVAITTPDTMVCEGTVFVLHVAGSNTYNYTWSPLAGLSDGTVKEPTVTALATTTYTVSASQPGLTGCIGTASVTVTVVSTDFVITSIDTAICEGAILQLNAPVTPAASTYTYQWSGPRGYNSVLQNPVVTTSNPNDEGTYTVTVTNQGICSKQSVENVTIFPTPSDNILGPEIKLCQFSPAISLKIPHYDNLVWYPSPSDSVSTVFAPVPNTDSLGVQHYYAAQISFGNNCIGHIQGIDVTIESCCNGTLFVPSGFTPNNDGRNDVLRVIKSAEYKIDEFIIFNRWGNMVFQAAGEEISWDGTINGQPADIGTYYYTLTANCVNSGKAPITQHGDITLLK